MKTYFQNLLSLVSAVTGITKEDILGKKKDESVTDARYILVYFLSQKFTNKEICDLTGMIHSRVSYLLNGNRSRSDKFTVKINMAAVHYEMQKRHDLFGE